MVDNNPQAAPVPPADPAPATPPRSEPRTSTPDGLPLGPRVFGPWSWITVILPLVVYLMGNMFGGYLEGIRVEHLEKEQLKRGENTSPKDEMDEIFAEETEEPSDVPQGVVEWFGRWFPDEQTWYPSTYTLTIGIVTVLVIAGFPGYFRAPFRFTSWGAIVGVIGVVVWVGLWYLDEHFLHIGSTIGPYLGGKRSEFNPFEALKDTPSWMYQFLGIRLFGMILIVPLIEEFFLRGFLMRYIDDPDWDQIPLGMATIKSILGVVVYAVVSHPAELFAAAVWFAMVTWLYLKTRNIWDCVLAHSLTNALLAAFILTAGRYEEYKEVWQLW